jgi:RalA-binding protein 1
MHETALHGETSDEVKPPFMTDTLRDGVIPPQQLTAAHINAITMCLGSIKDIFDTFLSMEIYSIRCIPVFNFVRIAYGVVVLIKIYFTAAAPDSEFGAIMSKDQIPVLYYLDNLLEKFRATASSDGSRPAAKFLVVLLMLRRWFISHSEDEAGSGGGQRSTLGSAGTGRRVPTPVGRQTMQTPTPGPPAHAQIPTPQQGIADYPAAATANTPLQLLSEIATTDSGLGDRPSHLPWLTRAQAGHPIQQPFIYDDTAGPDKVPGPGPAAPQAAVDDGSMGAAAAAAGGGIGSWLSQAESAAGGFMPDLLDLSGYGDALDWEGLAMSFGMGLPPAFEQGVRGMMQQQGDLMKPWFGDGGMESMSGADGSMYPPPPQH